MKTRIQLTNTDSDETQNSIYTVLPIYHLQAMAPTHTKKLWKTNMKNLWDTTGHWLSPFLIKFLADLMNPFVQKFQFRYNMLLSHPTRITIILHSFIRPIEMLCLYSSLFYHNNMLYCYLWSMIILRMAPVVY